MSIYTNLIEQTKKEIEECETRSIRLALLQKSLETLQLAEKMHEEFVEKLKNGIDEEISYLKNKVKVANLKGTFKYKMGFCDMVDNSIFEARRIKRQIEEINRPSNSQEQMGRRIMDLPKPIRDSSDNRRQSAVKQTISHTPDTQTQKYRERIRSSRRRLNKLVTGLSGVIK